MKDFIISMIPIILIVTFLIVTVAFEMRYRLCKPINKDEVTSKVDTNTDEEYKEYIAALRLKSRQQQLSKVEQGILSASYRLPNKGLVDATGGITEED